jgi:hypothetical protein
LVAAAAVRRLWRQVVTILVLLGVGCMAAYFLFRQVCCPHNTAWVFRWRCLSTPFVCRSRWRALSRTTRTRSPLAARIEAHWRALRVGLRPSLVTSAVVTTCGGVRPCLVQSSQTELHSIRSEFLRTAVDRASMIQSRIESYTLCACARPARCLLANRPVVT